MTTHVCKKCGKRKKEYDFHTKRKKYEGKIYSYKSSYCIECEKEYNRKYYLDHTKPKRKEIRHGKE